MHRTCTYFGFRRGYGQNMYLFSSSSGSRSQFADVIQTRKQHVRNGNRDRSSSWHGPGWLQPPIIYILHNLGHHTALRGQRSCGPPVFPSTGVLCHSTWDCSIDTAALCRYLHWSGHQEEPQA